MKNEKSYFFESFFLQNYQKENHPLDINQIRINIHFLGMFMRIAQIPFYFFTFSSFHQNHQVFAGAPELLRVSDAQHILSVSIGVEGI